MSTIRTEPHVVWQDLPGELVLFDQRGNAYHCLDATGSDIWRLLAANGDVDAAVTALIERYDAPRPRIEADVARFVADLRNKRLIADDPADA